MKTITITSLLATAALAGCALDVPDLNNPGIDSLRDHPTTSAVSAACTGLIIGNRSNIAAENGYVEQLGILGRESFNFDQADPRYITEMLQGQLSPGSPFGGNFWTNPYANLRLGTIILEAIPKVADYTDTQRQAITGFVDTMMALDLLEVVDTHDTNGAVIAVNDDLNAPLPPIVDKPTAMMKIASLLDDGNTALGGGGDTFPFPLSPGYAGFDTPATFSQFNRALRARVAAYMSDYPTVLSALQGSFINASASTLDQLNVGVYHTYSTSPGDTTNGLVNPNIFVNPDIRDEMTAYTAPLGVSDARYNRKVTTSSMPGSEQGLTSNLVFTLYPSPSSPVPIIRNEELILLKAEAELETNDVAGATTDLNTIMMVSGGLPALAAAPTERDLVYNRNMSLLFEGGFRWIDARRFGLGPTDLGGLATSDQGQTFDVNIRYPIPLAECNARPGEPACTKGSL